MEDQDIDDVAVLILEESVSQNHVARLRRPEVGSLVHRHWWAFGFPDGMLGNSSGGEIGEELGYGWVRLDTSARYPIQGGYSGAALWSPDYEAVVGMVGQGQGGNGDGRAITLRAIDACLPEQKLHLLADWSAESAGESAMAAWGWSLTDDPEAGRHWRPRARGVSTDAERGFRFCGRTAALQKIVSWLVGEEAKRQILVVTGSPGVGKSAVLGRIVTTADASLSASLPPDESVRAPEGSVACAVHAKSKSALEVAEEVARAASANLPARVSDLASHIRDALESGGRTGFTVVIDALDEAASPDEARLILRRVAQPLAENLEDLGVRVVVGSRRSDDAGSLFDEFGLSTHILDLDNPEFFEFADLATYALATLQLRGAERRDNPYNDVALAAPVADRIAQLSEGNFLVAGLIARAHGMYDHQPVEPERLTFPPTVDAALHEYLDLLPDVDGVPANAVLTALAYAEAPGMPLDLWRVTISALGHAVPSEQHLLAFARSSAANFLVETSTADPQNAVFRLFHQALNDALVRRRSAVRDEDAIASALLQHGQSVGWSEAPAYLLRALPRHAERGRGVDQLLSDPTFALYADLRRLIPAATSASSPHARRQARLLRRTPRALDASPSDRAALLSVTETLDNLGNTYSTSTHPAPYRARWAAAVPHEEEAILEGHGDWVRTVCSVQAAGRQLLATASDDATVRLWDPETGELVRVLEGHSDYVLTVRTLATDQGKLLLTTSADGTARVWDPNQGETVRLFGGIGDWVRSACIGRMAGRTVLATASDDRFVRFWNMDTGREIRTVKAHHRHRIRAVCALGEVFAAAGDDGLIRLLDPRGGESIVLRGHGGSVNALCAFFLDERAMLATASADGTAGVWDLESASQHVVLKGHREELNAVHAFSLEGRTVLATASDDGTARLWDPSTGDQLAVFNGHVDWVLDVCSLPLGGRTQLATAGSDGTVRLWNPNREQHAGLRGSTSVGAACALPLEAGTALATASSNGAVSLVNPETGEQLRTIKGSHGWDSCVCAVPVKGRTLLATSSTDRSARLWDPETNRQVRVLKGHGSRVKSMCIITSKGRTLLATGSADATARLWNPENGKQLRVLKGHTGWVLTMCAIPVDDRSVLATGSADGTARLWDPESGRQLHMMKDPSGRVQSMCAVDVGGRAVLAAASRGTIGLWNPANGEQLRVLESNSEVRSMCAIGVDGHSLLAVASDDRTVRFWDPAKGQTVAEIPVGAAARVVIETDGLLLVSTWRGILALDLASRGLF
ncbi:AAA family ATPase [Streptomyces sp. NPDC002671]